MAKKDILKKQILELVRTYYQEVHASRPIFSPGKTPVNYGGRFFDDQEMVNLVDASLDFWLTAGPWAHKFEKRMAQWLDVKHCSLCNSGSSANLLAFSALTAPELKERRIKRGDEVITVAAGFPTTISCIIQNGAIPVFVDMDINEGNIDTTQLDLAFSKKTKAVMVAHSLGNPFNLEVVVDFCRKHHLWLIEDNCDALGTEYFIDGEWKKTGTIGDLGTMSFYPPHHMTMGEGGAVCTNDPDLNKYVRSYRDWGRDCWCLGGVDNTCGCRFDGQFGLLPQGYDHKYVYSHMGYNLKATDLQAAIGCAQLDKLDFFVKRRRDNYRTMYEGLKDVNGLLLPEPQKNSKPSWFGFFITVKEDAGYTRNELTSYLEEHKIQTRNLFAGNILKHPAFEQYVEGVDYRVIGKLAISERIMRDSFWLGLYPGMTSEKLQYMIKTIKDFVDSKSTL
ncbi:MAG: lipopolysaccharide biosynthesis protein RfbH [Bacteroidaceae bacterium]|nr:lipopolysaccharide biosynthesis protein RfbH [Bacteroidaceae bacterium]